MVKRKRRKYEPIISKSRKWPVVLLTKHRDEFVEDVVEDSFEKIIRLCPGKAALREELETTMYRERLRIKTMPWKADPPDETDFWNYVKVSLVSSATQKDDQAERKLLKEIITRYVNEIFSTFKPSRHRLARRIVIGGFRRLLNATKIKTLTGAITGKHTLRDKIEITGEIEQLRSLATKGIIVMVPTHFSNIDSVLIAWVIFELGLPPFIYGAGLNLFNIGLFAYFMNSLGAYKVDRRKKNLPYMETLKSYSTLAIQRGCHSLFFPGGTRSRSGKIEKRLKLGLLGTAIEAQRKSFQEAEENGNDARKIYVVPVTLNYNFVLEAPLLIRQYLERKGQERYYFEVDEYSTSYKIATFLIKFFTKETKISVSIGRALNLMGNYVDEEGNSLDQHGNIIDIREYFMSDGKITENLQREQEYTRMLSNVIVKEFHRINKVMPSHLVAYVGFRIWRKQYPKLDLYNFFRLPVDELSIPYNDFKSAFKIIKDQILQLHEEGRVDITDILYQTTDKIIETGLNNVGMYHVARPIIMNKRGDIITKDLHLLYFYHNRMDGYDLEEFL